MNRKTSKLNITTMIGISLGVAVLAGVASGVALASEKSGFTTQTLVTADLHQSIRVNSDKVKLQTKEPTDVRVQRVTLAAGGYSGWHHHPGLVLVAVESGTVTVTGDDCTTTTYGPGQAAGAVFVESGDAPGQVASAGGAVAYATFVTPDAQAPRVEDGIPACAR